MTQNQTEGQVDSLSDIRTIVDADLHVGEYFADILYYIDDSHSFVRKRIEEARNRTSDIYSITHPTPSPRHSEIGDEYGPDADPAQRRRGKIEQMTEFNIDQGILDPTLNLAINSVDNPTHATALANAYNTWLLDTFLDDESLRGNILIAPQQPKKAANEIDRLAQETEFVGIFMPSTGLVPPAGHQKYDPIYKAATRHGLPVSLHGAASATFHNFPTMRRWNQTYAEDHTLVHPFTQMWNLTTLVYRGIFERFPGLNIVIQESGISWIPFLKWRLDDHYMELSDDLPLVDRLPSEYINESVYFTTQPLGLTSSSRKHLPQVIEMAGPENIMYSSDLPHSDFDPPEELFDRIGHVFDDETIEKIMGRTAIELYGL